MQAGETHSQKKLVVATGVKDIMPNISGAADLEHFYDPLPYCHGYEVRQETTGILANGDMGFELRKADL